MIDEVVYKEVIVDDEYLRIYAKDMEHRINYFKMDEYEIHIETESKTGKPILIQARDEKFNAELVGNNQVNNTYRTTDEDKFLNSSQNTIAFRFLIFEGETLKILNEHKVAFELLCNKKLALAMISSASESLTIFTFSICLLSFFPPH